MAMLNNQMVYYIINLMFFKLLPANKQPPMWFLKDVARLDWGDDLSWRPFGMVQKNCWVYHMKYH